MEAKKTTRYTHSFLKKVSSIRGWSQFHGLGRVSCIYLGTRKSKAFGKRLSQGRHRVIFKRFRLFLRSSNPRTAPPTNCFSIRMNESTCIRHFDTNPICERRFCSFQLVLVGNFRSMLRIPRRVRASRVLHVSCSSIIPFLGGRRRLCVLLVQKYFTPHDFRMFVHKNNWYSCPKNSRDFTFHPRHTKTSSLQDLTRRGGNK